MPSQLTFDLSKIWRDELVKRNLSPYKLSNYSGPINYETIQSDKSVIDSENNLNIKWSILDTFDALSPRYDYPLTKKEIENHLKKYKNIDYTLHYGSNGIVLNLTKLKNYKNN